MQRAPKLLAVGLIVVLVGLSVVRAINLDRERQRVADGAQQRHADKLEVDPLRPAQGAQPEKRQIAPHPSHMESSTADAAPPDLRDVHVTRAKAHPKGPLSPEHRAAHRAEGRIYARKEFGALFQMLELSPQQEHDFINVIVAERVAEPLSVAEWRADRDKRAREQAEKISAVIGDDKVPKYENYLRNRSEHARVTQIGMQLDAAGAPLSKEQKTYLFDLMVAERERVRQPSKQKPIATTADIDRELAWMEDQDRRIREGAASMLSTTQLEYLDEVLTARLARRRVDLYMIPVASAQ